MFRITTHTADRELVLRLEGSLTGSLVREIEGCWRDTRALLNGRQLRVDLTALCRVDDEGRTLLAAMHAAGAHFVTRGCVMPEVVREIAESVPTDPAGFAPSAAVKRS
jgi:ABC-type transporter Mla MlaB component